MKIASRRKTHAQLYTYSLTLEHRALQVEYNRQCATPAMRLLDDVLNLFGEPGEPGAEVGRFYAFIV